VDSGDERTGPSSGSCIAGGTELLMRGPMGVTGELCSRDVRSREGDDRCACAYACAGVRDGG
jgi:hypothetical protein